MPVNPYVLPAKYEYKPLPLDFMLQAGLAQQARFNKADAALEDLQSKLIVPFGYSTQDAAKEYQTQLFTKLKPIQDAYASGDMSPDMATRKFSNLYGELQRDPVLNEFKSDAALKELAAKQVVDPLMYGEAAQRFYDPVTKTFKQRSLAELQSGLHITPDYYAMIPRVNFGDEFKPKIDEMKPEKWKFDPVTKVATLGVDDEGKDIQKVETTQEEFEALRDDYVQSQLTPYAKSEGYKNTPFHTYYKEKFGKEMTPEEFLKTSQSEFAHRLYQYGDKSVTTSNVPTPKKGAGATDKKETSFWDSEWTSNNLENKNIFENIINPKSGDSYSALVESTTPTPDALKTLLESKDAVMTEDADGNPTYTYASSGAPMTTADAIATEAAVNDLSTKVNNSKMLLAQMQPTLDAMNKTSPYYNEVFDVYNSIGKADILSGGYSPGMTATAELPKLRQELEYTYSSVSKTPDGNYVGHRLDGSGMVNLDPEKGSKLYAIQVAESPEGRKIKKQYESQREAQNDYIKKELTKSNIAGQMMILHDNKDDGKVTNELHQSFASALNSSIKAGSVLDREGLISTNDFLGKNGSGEFHGADFDPHSIYQKDGSWYARGNFVKKVTGGTETSPAIDINVNDIIKQQLPESADLQLQVFKQMDDQMQYILPGKQGVINLFGNRLDDLNTTQVKVTRGKDNSVTIESPNGLFADYDAKTGIYKPHYVKGPQNYPSTSEASLDLLQSQIRIQQEREESPYAFDDNGNYVGDVGSDDPRENEATVRSATDFISKSLNWDDKMIEGLIKTIDFETGHTFNPSEKNNTTGAGAVGLIQFYPDKTVNGKQYKRIGNTDYSMEQLANMSAHEQMKGPVVDYLAQFQNDIKQPHDIYLAVFQPALLKSKEYKMNGLDTKLDKVTEVTNWATIKRDNPAIFDKTKNGGKDIITVKDLLEAAQQL